MGKNGAETASADTDARMDGPADSSRSAEEPVISCSRSALEDFSRTPRSAILSSVSTVVYKSKVEALDKPNPTKDDRGGRPGCASTTIRDTARYLASLHRSGIKAADFTEIDAILP